ncbi:MAG: CesT family type III secretion system chaperone [Kiritimatiellae bacterium]|nr:CesT family type III secretion system chaperone [Kiritimatiellia bacterium]
MIPEWISAPIREFGRAAGLDGFALNGRGVASVSFETGSTLSFEFADDSLSIVMTVPAGGDPATARGILCEANPDARRAFRVRAGRREKTGRAVFAERLAARDVTTPAISAAFSDLWRITSEYGGAR